MPKLTKNESKSVLCATENEKKCAYYYHEVQFDGFRCCGLNAFSTVFVIIQLQTWRKLFSRMSIKLEQSESRHLLSKILHILKFKMFTKNHKLTLFQWHFEVEPNCPYEIKDTSTLWVHKHGQAKHASAITNSIWWRSAFCNSFSYLVLNFCHSPDPSCMAFGLVTVASLWSS